MFLDKMKTSALLLCLGVSGLVHSQSIEDAVRYSFSPYNSTARSIGVGGSMSPLGADISVANVNPAGIAEFRKSEFAISFGLPMSTTDAQFAGAIESDDVTAFKVNSIGAVFAYDPPAIKTRTMNIAIGVNKLADFNQNIYYGGTTPGTRVERFLELANLRTLNELSDFEEGLAYDAQVILDEDGDLLYESDFVSFEEQLFRDEIIERSGQINELFFSFASNIQNKISYGLTLGIPIVDYTETRDYLEADDLFFVNSFDQLYFLQNLNTTGGGINAKAGIIIKPVSKLRLSAAIHSPSWLFLTDEFSNTVEFFLDGEENGFAADSPVGESQYTLRTPWRAFLGLGYIYDLGDVKGFLNGEVEYVDYSGSNFSLTTQTNNPEDEFIFDDLNAQAGSELTSAINIRVGTEIAIKHLRLRAGTGIMGSPYADSDQYKIDPMLNAGLGWRGDKFYIDLAWNQLSLNQQYTPYQLEFFPEAEQIVETSTTQNRFGLTLGFKI